MQEMLYPTSYLKSKGLGAGCALITDGRFSGGTSGLSIAHVSPEAAEGGAIGLIEKGPLLPIHIPSRTITPAVAASALADRRADMDAEGDARADKQTLEHHSIIRLSSDVTYWTQKPRELNPD